MQGERQPIIYRTIPFRYLIDQTAEQMRKIRCPEMKLESYIGQEFEQIVFEWRRVWLPLQPDSPLLFPFVKKESKRDKRFDTQLSDADRARVMILKVEHGLKAPQIAERFGVATQCIRRVIWEEERKK
jgi:hypothetical protein